MTTQNTPFFFTSWSDAKIGGGRDPLGLQTIWSNIARLGIQGVNSVSGDIMGWRTLLVAAGIAQWLKPNSKPNEHQDLMQVFERLAAYVRMDSSEQAKQGVRGSTRVFRHLSDIPFSQIRLKDSHADYRAILADQRQTGVVGQIVGPAQNLNLLNSDFYLTPIGLELWEVISPTIKPFQKELEKILIKGEPLQEEIKSPIISLVGPKFISAAEVQWYEKFLLQADGIEDNKLEHWKHDRQVNLVTIIRELKEKHGTSTVNLETLLPIATPYPDVETWLQDIQKIETVIGVADRLFRWLLRECKDEKNLAELAEKLSKEGILCQNELQLDSRAWKRLERATLSSYGSERGKDIIEILKQLTTTDSQENYLHQLLQLNGLISKYRRKSAWIEQRGGKWITLNVYFSESTVNLSSQKMEHSYYLNNFSRLIYACKYEEMR